MVLKFFFCVDRSKPLLRNCNPIIILVLTGIPGLQPLSIFVFPLFFFFFFFFFFSSQENSLPGKLRSKIKFTDMNRACAWGSPRDKI